MKNTNYELITILGPTASGKTALAARLAAHLGSEVISADSRQVYRRMDVGSGKDLDDYIVDNKQVAYHLINIREPGERYNVFEYQHDFHKVFQNLRQKNIIPVLCGGSGMYIEAVLKGFRLLDVPPNPELRQHLCSKSLPELTAILSSYKKLHNKTDVDSPQRAIRAIEIEEYYRQQTPEQRDYKPINSLIIGIDVEREQRRRKITDRLRKRLDEGMLDEVRSLLASGVPPEDLIYYGLEYKFVTLYLTGQTSYNDMFTGLEIAIHQFAKRQMTWFRGMERRGFVIQWIDAALPTEDKLNRILSLLFFR